MVCTFGGYKSVQKSYYSIDEKSNISMFALTLPALLEITVTENVGLLSG